MSGEVVVRSAGRYRCGEGGIPHVWETYLIPPSDKARCLCGQLAWWEGVALARIQAEKRWRDEGGTQVLPPK